MSAVDDEEDRRAAFERNLDVYIQSPRFEDYRVGPLVRRIREAAERDQGLDLELDQQDVAELDSLLRLGDAAIRIVRELSVETWKLPGMSKLRDRRRDEVLAGNYLSLRGGGASGDGRVRLQRPDEHAAGEPAGACFYEGSYGGPLSPVDAVGGLADFEGCSWSAMLKRLQRAKQRLGAEFALWDHELAGLPNWRQDPTEDTPPE